MEVERSLVRLHAETIKDKALVSNDDTRAFLFFS
jgi:hypothetical protein